MSVSAHTGSPMPARRKWLALAGFVVLCLAVGGIAGWATSGSIDSWYRTIAKPDWTPPAPQPKSREIMALVGTVVIFAVISGIHYWLGVSPFPT